MKYLLTPLLFTLTTEAALASTPLPGSTPEAQGLSSSALLAFVEAAEKEIEALHGLVLVRHGHVVAQGWWKPYGPETPHQLFSLSKSFTSTAIGLAVEEGLLSLDDPVLSFFPEETPAEPGEHLKNMRIRQLLSMSTGHHEDTTGSFFEREGRSWTAAFLQQPVAHKPGTHFLYNTGATFMLSAILQKVTGTTLLDYLRPRLFEPLGIEHPTWETNPQGISIGGWGLSITTGDIARFGQLYLQKGEWNGHRLLPAAWIEEATARQVSNGFNPDSDWDQGYGYQFWRCRHNAYRGDGAFGQFCIVLPQQDAVLAITSGVPDMQAVLNLAWEHLLPAMQDQALPDDRETYERLEKKLASLSLAPQPGQTSSPLAKQVSGKTFRFSENEAKLEWVRFDFGKEGSALTLRNAGGEHRLEVSYGRWSTGHTRFDSDQEQPYAASGAWTGTDTYVVKLCLYATPFRPTLTFQFGGDLVVHDFEYNVGFGPTRQPQLMGRVH
jgi:CubicO group peptidase (beta-lactamase class C family)